MLCGYHRVCVSIRYGRAPYRRPGSTGTACTQAGVLPDPPPSSVHCRRHCMYPVSCVVAWHVSCECIQRECYSFVWWHECACAPVRNASLGVCVRVLVLSVSPSRAIYAFRYCVEMVNHVLDRRHVHTHSPSPVSSSLSPQPPEFTT